MKLMISYSILGITLLASVGIFAWSWPIWIFITAFLFLIMLIAYGSFFINSNFYIKTRCHGLRENNSIAISFDDGPIVEKTIRILDLLKERNIQAAFFCVGKNIAILPDILQRIDKEGHIIGNHSYYHGKFFDFQSSSKMYSELHQTNQIIFHIIKKKPRLFRPPYGVTNPSLARAIKQNSLETIGWSLRSFDTIIKRKDRLLKRITKNLKPGDIILFHDYCEVTIEILPDLFEYISKNGLKVERLDKLLKIKPYA